MPSMKFADILLENNPRSVTYPGMYCRSDQPVIRDSMSGEWKLSNAGTFDFTTYFNSLSVEKLLRYTKATGFALHLELKGAACTVTETYGDTFSMHSQLVDSASRSLPASDDWQTVDLPLALDPTMVILGFQIATKGSVFIRNSYYTADYEGELNEVELALATTTFKKESYIINNIGLVRKEILSSSDEIAQHFHMYVIDNGRTLDVAALSGDRVTVIPNDNVGGAGGFTRGMITAMEQTPQATNIILMDDDVSVSPESIKRTYSLLRLLKPEHQEATISGAMLNYEVGEDQSEDVGFITDEGTFVPCKPGRRITIFEDIVYNEKYHTSHRMNETMYAGWWYCCIPISVIKRNGLPLPFFVRCDDAEYGVRCKTEFITMNGICVWHMPFYIRYNAAVYCYQVVRNSMISQFTTGIAPKVDFMTETKHHFQKQMRKFNYVDAELCLKAMNDFFKGPDFYSAPGVAEQTFIAANKEKEHLLNFEELQKALDADPDFEGLQLSDLDLQKIDGDKPRNAFERLEDRLTENWQRGIKREGEGYAVIPLMGWALPSGAIRGKKKLLVIDRFNRQGIIRVKDADRYTDVMKRWNKAMRYLKAHEDELRQQYAASRDRVTSVDFWKRYLKMD